MRTVLVALQVGLAVVLLVQVALLGRHGVDDTRRDVRLGPDDRC